MRKSTTAALALLSILAAALPATAQTKGETKLYEKTVAKPSVKAFDKFLLKYPQSIYSRTVLTLRDSTLFAAVDLQDVSAVYAFAQANPDSPISDRVWSVIDRLETPLYSDYEAAERLSAALPGGIVTEAVAYRNMGRDYAVGVAVNAPDMAQGSIRIYKLDLESGGLTSEDMERYTNNPSLDVTAFSGDAGIVTFDRRKCMFFSYVNGSGSTDSMEYVAALYDIENNILSEAMFYGRNMPEKGSSAIRIEGQSPESLSEGFGSVEQSFLVGHLSSNPSLVPISEADILTDSAIEWWLMKNPDAGTRAGSVTFGLLDEKSSLVDRYKFEGKEDGKGYFATMFDFRGYTVIVSRSKSTGEYSLVWAEPVCRDKNRDKLLNTIYFEKGSTLVLFYYKGKTTFKYRLSLASKTLTR